MCDNNFENLKGHILVMDDDEIIRTYLYFNLLDCGYAVHVTSNGSDAILCYTTAQMSGYPFNAVILDLHVRNGKGGEETVRELIKIDPQVRAIVSSGNLNDPAMLRFREYGFIASLPKPYTKYELKLVIDEVIHAVVQKTNGL